MPTLTVLALHGFSRRPQHLTSFSEACRRRGWACVRPSLAPRWMPVLMNNRRHLDQVADRLVSSGRLTGPIVIVGHSAGAAAGSWMAPVMIGQGVDVRGLVYVDGNDSPNHLIEQAWPDLDELAIRGVMAPPSPCNRQGRLSRYLQERRPGSVVVVPRAGHGDLEGRSSSVYRWACGDAGDPGTWHAVQLATLDAIEDLDRRNR